VFGKCPFGENRRFLRSAALFFPNIALLCGVKDALQNIKIRLIFPRRSFSKLENLPIFKSVFNKDKFAICN